MPSASKENVIEIDVKDLRGNFDRIPSCIKYQRKLIQEIETVQFSLFLGLSNIELLQDEHQKTSQYDSIDRRSSKLSRDIMDPPKLKVSAPRHICSLYQDVNELF